MTYYTLVHKTVICPQWHEEITLTAKYHYFDPERPLLATFSYATCEIIENLKLPLYKQDPRLKLFRFCSHSDCPLLHDFEKQIGDDKVIK